jgi:hypothetical protein
MPWLDNIFSVLGLGPSNKQLQQNKELAQSGLSGAVEMGNISITGGKRRRRSKRSKASKRKASKRSKASKRKASKRSKASKRK